MSKKAERGSAEINQNYVDNALAGTHAIGDGLYLIVKNKGGALYGSWIFRKQIDRKRTDYALGSTRKLSLKQAKVKASAVVIALDKGEDPRLALGKPKKHKHENKWLLSAVFERLFESKKPTLKGDGANGRWESPVANHILPTLGKTDVREIGVEDVRKVLSPIWHEKSSVAIKAYNRFKMAVEFAADEGADVDENAFKKAKRLLGAQDRKPKHLAAMDPDDLPTFYKRLCEQKQSSATLALRFAILTINRAKPVREAMLSEIDLDAAIWTVPEEKLKSLKGKADDIRCPLSDEALKVIALARHQRRGDVLFPNKKGTGYVSDVGLAKWLRVLNANCTTHGFRSTFGDWASENDVPFDLAERCLQHKVGNAVAQAYRRKDQLEKRREVMQRWADFVTQEVKDAETAAPIGLRVIK